MDGLLPLLRFRPLPPRLRCWLHAGIISQKNKAMEQFVSFFPFAKRITLCTLFQISCNCFNSPRQKLGGNKNVKGCVDSDGSSMESV
ncbi:hypothetical protein VNO80_25702 [Phaseolus coccineus]|uniref:Uncharacterized protein n=1 Tax=Phaseolus coccineus TaxID=3886 RepID=A0AAN9LVS0_PHACN